MTCSRSFGSLGKCCGDIWKGVCSRNSNDLLKRNRLFDKCYSDSSSCGKYYNKNSSNNSCKYQKTGTKKDTPFSRNGTLVKWGRCDFIKLCFYCFFCSFWFYYYQFCRSLFLGRFFEVRYGKSIQSGFFCPILVH